MRAVGMDVFGVDEGLGNIGNYGVKAVYYGRIMTLDNTLCFKIILPDTDAGAFQGNISELLIISGLFLRIFHLGDIDTE